MYRRRSCYLLRIYVSSEKPISSTPTDSKHRQRYRHVSAAACKVLQCLTGAGKLLSPQEFDCCWYRWVASNCLPSGTACLKALCMSRNRSLSRGTIFHLRGKFGQHNVIECYLYVDDRTVSSAINGASQRVAFSCYSFSPTLKAFELKCSEYCLKRGSAEFNSGSSPFSYASSGTYTISEHTGLHKNYCRLCSPMNQLVATTPDDFVGQRFSYHCAVLQHMI